MFVVCTSDDAAVSDVFGRDVLTEAYKRDEADLCADNHDEIPEVTKEELDFEHRDGTRTLVGERGVDVQDLTRIPVE